MSTNYNLQTKPIYYIDENNVFLQQYNVCNLRNDIIKQ